MLGMASMILLGCSRPGCSATSMHLTQHVAIARMYAVQAGWRLVPGAEEPQLHCPSCVSANAWPGRAGVIERESSYPDTYLGPEQVAELIRRGEWPPTGE
jgi:hypothetical protein